MTKIIVEYEFTNLYRTTPTFIEDCGYFRIGSKVIGVSDDTRDDLPQFDDEDSLSRYKKYTRTQLKSRMLGEGMNGFNIDTMSATPYIDQEIEDEIDAWCDEKNIP